jgi:hypothetical protein
MVVDLQDVKVESAFLLTHPALHYDDLLRFPETRTNLGVKGMREFFRTHVCSEVCILMDLPLPPTKPTRTVSINSHQLYYDRAMDIIDETDLEPVPDC